MKTINVLSIGNSFSQDAHRYIHDLAKSEGVIIETTNLYIGGCPLDRHFRNMQGDTREYGLEINGHMNTGFMTTIKEGLLAKEWDYVTLQQASHLSYQEDSYQPYLAELVKYIRTMCPKTKVLMHETWGYETGSVRCTKFGFESYEHMFTQVKCCYEKAAKEVQADGIIPGGTALGYALQKGIPTVHRDALHLSLGLGRLILAMTWYGYLTSNSIDTISFNNLDAPVSEEEYRIAKEAVKLALGQE